MKNLGIIIIMLITLIGCNEKEINFNKLQHKNGLFYEIENQKPFTGKSKDSYANGHLKAEINYKNGEFEGPYKSYYENGHLNAEGNYKNGQLEGPYKGYYENGQLKAEGNYKNGELIFRTIY